MPRFIPFRLVAACALALFLFLSTAAVAAAKKVEADLRVVGKHGRVIAEQSLRTGTTKVPTSSKATCFGRASRGSGRKATVKGPTALGLLAQAARSNRALRPFYVTDAFSFGLGLCTVGGFSATAKESWYLKVNHRGSLVGGDAVKLKPGDDVLWALAKYPYPNELALEGPGEAAAGVPFAVRVYSYDEKGKRRPAKGATVTGGAGPTDARGRTTVVVDGPTTILAVHGKDIPSNSVGVCVAAVCP